MMMTGKTCPWSCKGIHGWITTRAEGTWMAGTVAARSASYAAPHRQQTMRAVT